MEGGCGGWMGKGLVDEGQWWTEGGWMEGGWLDGELVDGGLDGWRVGGLGWMGVKCGSVRAVRFCVSVQRFAVFAVHRGGRFLAFRFRFAVRFAAFLYKYITRNPPK